MSTNNPQQAPKASSTPNSASRRRFLLETTRTVGGVALFSLGIGLYSRQSSSLPAEAIRPPGALNEKDFLGACIRCGSCVRDCPFDTLDLARLGDLLQGQLQGLPEAPAMEGSGAWLKYLVRQRCGPCGGDLWLDV